MKTTVKIRTPRQNFAPDHTFACGQTFRYFPEEGGWCGIAKGNLVRVRDTGTETVLTMTGQDIQPDAWQTYFDLDRDYAALFPDPDPVLEKALAHAPGLRVLRQEPFETLISFIVSANNNIPRITRIIAALCEEAGEAFPAGGQIFRAFPSPDALAAVPETRLRELGAGYRAQYIAKTSRLAAQQDLEALEREETGKLLEMLQTYPGVGPKVARCTALFGYGRTEVFPADVWIIRMLKSLYGFTGTAAQADAFAARQFGAGAGIAQQYLYHYIRSQ